MIATSFAILLMVAAGLPLAALIDPEARGSRRVGESILLGLAASGFLLLVIAFAGISWSRLWLIAGLAALVAVCTLVRRPAPWRLLPISVPTAVATGVVVILLGGYALVTTLAPIPENDFVSNWGMKARAFWERGGIDWAVLATSLHHDAHPEYPVLLPLMFDAVTILRGAWDDRSLGLLYVAFAAGLLLVIHGIAREGSGSDTFAAILVVALVPFAASPWVGLAEGPFVAYSTTALLLLRHALERDQRHLTMVAAIFLGVSTSIKEEGWPFLVAVAIGLIIAERAAWIVRLWPAVLIPLPWILVRSRHQIPELGRASVDTVLDRVANMHEIFATIARAPLGRPVYWAGIILAVILLWRMVSRERFVVSVLLLQAGAYIAAYVVSPFEVERIKWSTERLLSHLTPALTVVLLLHLLTIAMGNGARAPIPAQDLDDEGARRRASER
ncbi:MAG TPA: hypothetical protein VFL80_06485 [Thermoanaerobaculia bacterium]|nr:hypothetical protein [Thermoanaerobaculia bacterium]